MNREPRRVSAALGWLAGLACGCELTTELGTYALAEGETTETSAGEGEPGDGDETSADDGEGEPDTSLCMIDGSESPCRICLEHLCCEQLENCDAELGCFCMLDCLVASDPITCAMTCTPGVAYFQLLQCRATSCAAVCQ
jgi:hypothetical protein